MAEQRCLHDILTLATSPEPISALIVDYFHPPSASAKVSEEEIKRLREELSKVTADRDSRVEKQAEIETQLSKITTANSTLEGQLHENKKQR